MNRYNSDREGTGGFDGRCRRVAVLIQQL